MAKFQDVEIITTANRKVAFSGTSISESSSDSIDFHGVNVWFRLRIWAKQDGGYAPSISVFVDNELEPRFIESEFVDSPTDVENFFFVFEPGEMMDLLMPGKFQKDERIDPSNRVYAAYERRVTEILAEFTARLEQSDLNESATVANPADSS